MWMIPSQFGDALEQFAKAYAKKDDDGVFRYEAALVDEETKDLAGREDTDQWFETAQDPEIARAVAEARAVANKPVDSPLDEQEEREKPAISSRVKRNDDPAGPSGDGASRPVAMAGEPQQQEFPQVAYEQPPTSQPGQPGQPGFPGHQ